MFRENAHAGKFDVVALKFKSITKSKYRGEALKKKLSPTKKQKLIRRNLITFIRRRPASELNQNESQDVLRVTHDGSPF